MTRSADRLRRGLAALALCAGAAAAHAAVGEDELLPVDEAFALGARAVARDRIEVDWAIADGYYLYRHRIDVRPDAAFAPGPLQLPAGKKHTDEFFGEVETYRRHVTAALDGHAAADARRVTLTVKYQGCADIGICYPPQTRTVQVALPDAGQAAGTTRPSQAADSGFAALGRSLGGAPSASPAPGVDPAGRPQALPLPPEQAFGFEAIAADGNRLLLRFTPAKNYYLYRDRSSFRLDGPEGISLGTPRWPRGVSHRDEHFGDVVVYFDRIDVPLPLRRRVIDAGEVTLQATFQGCQLDGICYPPMTRTVTLALPAGRVETVAEATTAQAEATAAPKPLPATPGETSGSTTPGSSHTAGETSSETRDAGPGAASAPDASADNAARTRPPGSAPPRGGVLGALLLALLGGLVLNLMPCVLPILSLKVLGLAQSGESRARARSHALWYALGVLAAFAAVGALVLALRAGGQALGWGFQLQQPWFVAALVYLMFAVGLSLSGVFTLGGGFGNVGQRLASKTGPAGDFFTGVLACVVASPCIAPFMGGALAFAFTASPLLALAVFLMLGLGLALPFLLVGFVPALADRLPRPGAWMETLKQVLAFPMYLTAIWLLWVLGRQRGVDAMALVAAGLALFALALWWHERRRWTGGAAGRALALLLAALALWPVWKVGSLPPPQGIAQAAEGAHEPWSAERLQALRDEGRAVFVNMTADWCVTCKANEKRVLSQPAFRGALADSGAAYLVGDYTNADPAITAFLDAHRAVGVPLYVVYPAGGGEGEVLPALLSDDIVVSALRRAAR